MNRTVKSLLAAGALAAGLSACATYDAAYAYTDPYYGYDYRPYAYGYAYRPYAYNYDYRPYAYSYDYGYGDGNPYYGSYAYAPGYYVGPSFGLGLSFHDHGRSFDRDHARSWRGDHDGRGTWSGQQRRSNAADTGRRNAGQARIAPARSAPHAVQPAPVERSTQARAAARGQQVAPAPPNAQRAQSAPRSTRPELRAEQRD